MQRSLPPIFIFLVSLALFLGWPGSKNVLFTYASAPIEFYYFNPDSPQNNLERLKLEMEKFLAAAPYKITFQPFARLGDFDDKIKEKHPALTFLPDWYLKEFGQELGFRPLLTTIERGIPSYRKVLLTTKDADITVGSVKDHSLAMTSMGPAEKAIIAKTLFPGSQLRTDSLNVILVPKDSDALIALTLKQVDMALVGKNTLELLSQINPKVVASTKVIAESEPIPLPTLCYRDGAVTSEQLAGIKELFMNADKSSEKPKIMEMLRIDRWQSTSD